MKPIKILQIQPEYQVKTSDLQEEIMQALAEFDTTSAYLTQLPSPGDNPSHSRQVKFFDFNRRNLKGLRIGAVFQLWKFCRQHRFDVIITHRFKPLYLVLIVNKLLSQKARCFSVIHANGEFDRPYRRFLLRYLADQYWTFIGVSSSVRANILAFPNTGLSETKVTFINNALDVEKIDQGLLPTTMARQQLGLEQDHFVFGTIGRLVKVKGHIDLLKAFLPISQRHSKARLVIIGGGELQNDLYRFITANQMQKSVILTGPLTDAFQYLKAFDVFVLSSHSEGLPLAVLEAMIAHRPIIATDVGSTRSVIGDRGCAIRPKDIPALTTNMQRYLNTPLQELEAIGNALRHRVEQEFSIQTFRSQYRNLVLSQSQSDID